MVSVKEVSKRGVITPSLRHSVVGLFNKIESAVHVRNQEYNIHV